MHTRTPPLPSSKHLHVLRRAESVTPPIPSPLPAGHLLVLGLCTVDPLVCPPSPLPARHLLVLGLSAAEAAPPAAPQDLDLAVTAQRGKLAA